MSYVLNGIVAPDSYSPSATIEDTHLKRVTLDSANQSIYYQLKLALYSSQGGTWETIETLMLAGSKVVVRKGLVGIRIRAAVPLAQIPAEAHQAVVTIVGVT